MSETWTFVLIYHRREVLNPTNLDVLKEDTVACLNDMRASQQTQYLTYICSPSSLDVSDDR
jgi:hypothetical protein